MPHKKSSRRSKKNIFRKIRGKADGGALFIVTTCLSIICLGLAFIGGDIPAKFAKSNPRIASVYDVSPAPVQSTLQLLWIKPKPAKLIPTIDPNARPLSSDHVPTGQPAFDPSMISGVYVPPSTNNCGGKYNIARLPGGKNYGDPNCTFTKDGLFSLLQQMDSKHASLWFTTIVPGESSYNPNAWAAPVGVQLSLDAGGAWGLFQMGSSKPAGQAPPAPGKNGALDRGDVNWETQATNAIGYNRKQSCSFRYWATARAQWGRLSC